MAAGQFDTDVIVVGGGPAGSATAITCAQRGLRVRLFERAVFAGQRPGETLHPGIEPLLRQLGVGERFRTTVGARHAGIWLSWGGRRRFEPYGSDGDGGWHGFQVARAAFDQLLLQHAMELGVEVRQPCAVGQVGMEEGRYVCALTEAGPVSAPVLVDATGRASWLSRRIGVARTAQSPRLIARYGYVGGCRPGGDGLPELIGNTNGWTWTATVEPGLHAWTHVAVDGSRPERDWVPTALRGLAPVGPSRGADVTWRLAARPADPAWFMVGDAACLLDPLSSKGVLRAMMSGVAAGDLIAHVLRGRMAASAAAAVYQNWLGAWFSEETRRLRSFYREIGLQSWAI
jgi:flavin-dependent dehydrogenase